MKYSTIPRTLQYEDGSMQVTLTQSELLSRSEPLVVLGEAGMGKTSLLEWLSDSPQHAYCTARQLINRAKPETLLGDALVLVIDALDEVSARGDGDAVDLVLQKLGELGYPRFVLSCRVADWRTATGAQAIVEQYDRPPLALHLNPLTDQDVLAFLAERMGDQKAQAVVEHFDALGLESWLGNPQTLELIVQAVAGGNLPDTRTALFDLAIRELAEEHKDSKADDQLPRELALGAAGAACAALILSGSEAITRRTATCARDGELMLKELTQLPDGQGIERMLGTRLIRGLGSERFSYWHRRIGEYLGARWIAKHADSPRKRRRLMALFHKQGLVPASLRGLHAWLAQDSELASAVITADPMGVIEYGDADHLTLEKARTLLQALKRLAVENPEFRDWRSYTMRGLGQPGLIAELREIVADPNGSFWLRVLILESLKGSPTAQALGDVVLVVASSPREPYMLRWVAVDVLSQFLQLAGLQELVFQFEADGTEDSVSLALKLVDLLEYESFDDVLLARLVHLRARQQENTAGLFYNLERKLPISRIEGFLDSLAPLIKEWTTGDDIDGKSDLCDLVLYLAFLRIEDGALDGKKLWRWIEPFDEQDGYERTLRQSVQDHLQANDALRQTVQRVALLEQTNESSVWERARKLQACSIGFRFTEADVVLLLQALSKNDSSEEAFRDVLQLIFHDQTRGALARESALALFGSDIDRVKWINSLAEPRQLSVWELKQVERVQERREEQEKSNSEALKWYSENIDLVRSGTYHAVIRPAQVYLKLRKFKDTVDELEPHERISHWLDSRIAHAAYEGFEAFIATIPASPSAAEIAQAYAESKLYESESIVVAALAERLRLGASFQDLPDERIVAGMAILRNHSLEEMAGIRGLGKALDEELQRRDLWEMALRLSIEPHLSANREHVSGLQALMQDDRHEELAVSLADDWLRRFPNLRHDIEMRMVDRLLRSGRSALALDHLNVRVGGLMDDRRGCWDAVGLLVDFANTTRRLCASTIDPSLLWHIRDREPNLPTSGIVSQPEWKSVQLEWIIATFRSMWPAASSPKSGWVGDRGGSDAYDYLRKLVSRLGGMAGAEAAQSLERLRSAPRDSYTYLLDVVRSEQKRVSVEASYLPPSIGEVVAIAFDREPESIGDLQAWMLEELEVVQAKIRSDDAESWLGFYDDNGVPYEEERCRDHLLGLLRQGSKGVVFDPEGHIADDKEVDISCSVGALRLPIEIKGQWHRELWTGADQQLDRLYTRDWRACDRGIYLAFWFGDQALSGKRIASPGRSIERPVTPNQMREMLVARSSAARSGRIEVVVLDLSRAG